MGRERISDPMFSKEARDIVRANLVKGLDGSDLNLT